MKQSIVKFMQLLMTLYCVSQNTQLNATINRKIYATVDDTILCLSNKTPN